MNHEAQTERSPSAWARWLDVALVFLVFALYAGWPVPEPNEPCYLAKAKHYWNPAWIEDDFFLDSADSHWTFYVACGWPSLWLSLGALAWLGRLLTWALLALAWCRLSWTLLPHSGAAVVSAALLAVLNENFQMAGEWVIGGFEAKGIAYALVFAALAELVRGRWNATWALLGGAAAFHVLVGGWAVLAVGVCWLACGADRPRLASMAPGLAAGAVVCLAGLIPALALPAASTPEVVAAANAIYVYQRLPHHLSFFDFPARFRLRFAFLILAWGLLARFGDSDAGHRRLRRVVNASLIFVAIGICISAVGLWRQDLAAGLLRYYWFRLADVLLPLGVATAVTAVVYRLRESRAGWRAALPLALGAVACLMLAPQIATRFAPSVPRADKRGKVENHDDWRDACEWVAENTPPDARFLTPRTAQTFKWYAGRSEVVTWKDLPQDAKSIVAWRERLEDLYGTGDKSDPWYDSLAMIDVSRLRHVAERYDATFMLTDAQPPMDLPCPYRNETYAVYELSKDAR
jgi:hypothetical protein